MDGVRTCSSDLSGLRAGTGTAHARTSRIRYWTPWNTSVRMSIQRPSEMGARRSWRFLARFVAVGCIVFAFVVELKGDCASGPESGRKSPVMLQAVWGLPRRLLWEKKPSPGPPPPPPFFFFLIRRRADGRATVMSRATITFRESSTQRQFFRDSATQTVCSGKGVARYYDLVVGDSVNSDAAWFYPDPQRAATQIAGMSAFLAWRGDRSPDVTCGFLPKPPPPGVSITKLSPAAMRQLARASSASVVPSACTM